MKLYRCASTVIILTAMCYICIDNDAVSQCVTSTLTMCCSNLIPALFPFLVLADMLIVNLRYNDLPKCIGYAYQKIFDMPQHTLPVFISGIISGYPAGASLSHDMYENGYISKSCAERLICYTNNPGPMFVVSVIGTAVFGDIKIGIALYIMHIIATLVTGILTRDKNHYIITNNPLSATKRSIAEIIETDFMKVIKICGFITIFAIINEIISNIINPSIGALIACFTEITYGITKLAEIYPYHIALPLASFSLGWSGICICLQVKSVTKYKLNLNKYIKFKLLCGTIEGIICSTYIHLNTNMFPKTPNPNSIYALCYASTIICAYILIFIYIIKVRFKQKRNCM